jgi:hypothetical protein
MKYADQFHIALFDQPEGVELFGRIHSKSNCAPFAVADRNHDLDEVALSS